MHPSDVCKYATLRYVRSVRVCGGAEASRPQQAAKWLQDGAGQHEGTAGTAERRSLASPRLSCKSAVYHLHPN